MAVTSDNSTLIIAESYAKRLTALRQSPPTAVLLDRRVWADLGRRRSRRHLHRRRERRLVRRCPHKRCVRVREGGEVLQEIKLDRGCFACMLGGPDRRSLYMTACRVARCRRHGRDGADRPPACHQGAGAGRRLAVEPPVLVLSRDALADPRTQAGAAPPVMPPDAVPTHLGSLACPAKFPPLSEIGGRSLLRIGVSQSQIPRPVKDLGRCHIGGVDACSSSSALARTRCTLGDEGKARGKIL